MVTCVFQAFQFPNSESWDIYFGTQHFEGIFLNTNKKHQTRRAMGLEQLVKNQARGCSFFFYPQAVGP